MIKVEFNEEQKSNLLVFLDRVEYKGLKESVAIHEILLALQGKDTQNNKEK